MIWAVALDALRSTYGAEFRSVAAKPLKNERKHNVVGEIVA